MNQPEFDYTYTGADAYQPPQAGVEDLKGRIYHPYIPSDDLKEAVNLAIALQRPLLLEGEPGCGKTRLAGAVAYELTQKNLSQQADERENSLWWPYFIWNVKSIGRARDGLYRYDAVARLRDAQLVGSDPERLQDYLGKRESDQLKERLKDRKSYREFGPLGEALQVQSHRPVVLIDEIDKADSDFPNDLLLELDELRFEIPETGESISSPAQKPIIIITSNREKPLPEPFLRRCLYFYVTFPDQAQLLAIIKKRFGRVPADRQKLVKEAIAHFEQVKVLLSDQPGSRPPGTSEFLEFLMALLNKPVAEATAALKNLAKRSPLLGILLKTKPDQDLYRTQFPAQGDE
ncbi:MoxR family ATPase [Sphaerothrix gracilis]|uniref:AAA family ATPase n=1 Tax=Sphaerothrix gracilis TaxID=3151835 RepID=UPI0031FD892E